MAELETPPDQPAAAEETRESAAETADAGESQAVETERPEEGAPAIEEEPLGIEDAEAEAAAARNEAPLPEGQTDPALEAVEAAVVVEDTSIDMDALLSGAEPEPAPLEDAQLRAVIEAIVYVAEEPLTLAQLAAALSEPQDRVRKVLDQVIADFEKPEHGVTVREVAGGYKMATKPEHHDAVRAFVKSLKPPLKLSLPALETLAVIAYKQPVTAPEIMEIRGVQGAGVLKTLLDRKLIAGAGRKNVIGKPILYKTTKEFLIQFGLKDLSELPSLKEFEEIRRMAFTDDAAAAEPAAETAAEATPAGEAEAAAAPEAETAPVEAEARPEAAPEAPAETAPEPVAESAESNE